MAILNAIGAETGDISTVAGEAVVAVGSALASNFVVRTGDYSMKLAPTSAQSAAFGKYGADGKKASLALSTAYVTFWVYINATATGTAKLVSFGNSTTYGTSETCRLEITTSRTLQLVGTATGTATSALNTNTWYRIDLVIVNNGTCTISIDGVAQSSSNVTGNAQTIGYVHLGTAGTDATSIVYVDDLVIADAAIASEFDLRVKRLDVTADGNYTGWTASAGNKYDCVNDIPPDNTDYITAGTGAGDQRYSGALESCSSAGIPAGVTIHAAIALARVWEVTSTTTLGAIGIRAGSTDVETTNVDIGTTTNIVMGLVRTTNPADSAAWETTDLDGAEVIVKRSTSDTSNIRCGWMAMMVLYTPKVTLTGNQPNATGALALIKTLKSLAGNQPNATGTLTSLHRMFVALAGNEPNATGALSASIIPGGVTISGNQPNATGTLAFLHTLFAALAGNQPNATGALAVDIVLRHISLAGNQPNATGALALIKTLKTLSGNQPNATGALALILLSHLLQGNQPNATGALTPLVVNKFLQGNQPNATGALSIDLALRHISLAGNQPNATGSIAAVAATFVDLAGNQPASLGALVPLFVNKLLEGNQPNATGLLTALQTALVTLSGDQPFATGTLVGVAPVRDYTPSPYAASARIPILQPSAGTATGPVPPQAGGAVRELRPRGGSARLIP